MLCSNIFRTSHVSTWLWMHCQMVWNMQNTYFLAKCLSQINIYMYIFIYNLLPLRQLVKTRFFAYFRPFDNASRAMLKNDSSEICWSIIWNHQNPEKNVKTYKPTDLKTYKPTSIPYSLQRGAAAATLPPPPFGFYILIDVGLYASMSVGL